MANTNSFTPSLAGTKTISATATTASVTLNAADVGNWAVRITNAGPNTAYVAWGLGSAIATLNSMPVLAGTVEVFNCGNSDTFAAICAATQTASVYVTPGTGQ